MAGGSPRHRARHGDTSAGVGADCLGNIDATQTRFDEARTHYEESLDIARRLANDDLAGMTLANLGNVASSVGDWSRSRELYEEALGIFRSTGNDWSFAHALANLAEATLKLGDAAAAAGLYDEARFSSRGSVTTRARLWCLLGLAEALHHVGQRERSWQLYAEGLARVVSIGERRTIAYALTKGGLITLDDGDHREAEVFLATALRCRESISSREEVASDLTLLAEIATAAGEGRRAARLLGAATTIMAETGDVLTTFMRRRFERTAGELRAALGDADFDAAWAEGRSSLDGVVSEAAAASTDDLRTLIDYVAVHRPLRRAG